MNDCEIRKKIIEYLYGIARERGKNAGCEPEEIGEAYSIESKILDFNVRYLLDRGYARRIAMNRIAIDNKGADFVEGPSAFNPPVQFSQQKIEISGGNVGQINQAHIINNPSQFLNQLADAIEKHPEIAPGKKKVWKEMLSEMANSPVLIAILRALFSSAGT